MPSGSRSAWSPIRRSWTAPSPWPSRSKSAASEADIMTTSTSPTSLGTALSEQAIRNVNFFNGRLVTSRDMARTQEAQREADARLGQGIGAGIVHGLEIGIGDATQRQLTVTPGLAICAAGQTLCLGASQVVA